MRPMSAQPAVKYARSGDVSIAYAVTGSGPDVVIVPGWVSNVESMWSDLVAGSGIAFEDRGARALAGVPGEWRLYAVVAP